MRSHHLPQVVVVDADLRGLLRRVPDYEGYRVLEAADGLEALAIL
jgi:CheY-like chemotaxis protein